MPTSMCVPRVCPLVYPQGVSQGCVSLCTPKVCPWASPWVCPPSVGFSVSPHYHTELEFRKIIFLLLIACILYSALLS